MSSIKELKPDNITAEDKKQAFNEGNMDNTGKITNPATQKNTSKKKAPIAGSKTKDGR